ncbi:1-(5-phosphoribosyl)-5-[(5-phosphoribosylamino)methylideneamino]imidazole-4-carboxamide isomerase [Gottfriedia solisilvae]|uniref:1-(5-phosphoribosyl)-5-[(5-phosphoribosylamino)methylideneamino] imidazole-4-carboxamide isomerase n=1 Tax=Gottfriedia solisilvae TaxID=1516104 RepID=A0A8J3EZ43_9BACI|nr:1-(5-phosphoribosyl)-5-[(5-phosphoribosylamino)methylideneamino]imidazole-4-carboxamide isomerase [Gottfriedia solisilvae]GGI14026.1 1-(5-phosphoribosyl)-5-[(5-phosphoribosylamino) methylideneamino] imidazole-4-carboxamide isomerase [Gottfriedia solisilvae]
MILFPAIDLKDGKCVRLEQGDFSKQEIYSRSPLEVALAFEKVGATVLHIVDLDGARTGERRNASIVRDIVENTNLNIQLGGGIRSLESISFWLEIGIKNVILGTIAIENMNIVKEAVERYGERIIVGVDAKNSFVATNGWEKATTQNSFEFCKKLEKLGVKSVVYTDIAKDGMLSGPNIEAYKKLSSETNLQIIASGGVSSIDDLLSLQKLNLYGAISGKALYEKKFSLKEALTCLQEESYLA